MAAKCTGGWGRERVALFCPRLTCTNLQDKLNHLMRGKSGMCQQLRMKGEDHHKSDCIKHSHHKWLGRKTAVFSSDIFDDSRLPCTLSLPPFTSRRLLSLSALTSTLISPGKSALGTSFLSGSEAPRRGFRTDCCGDL